LSTVNFDIANIAR